VSKATSGSISGGVDPAGTFASVSASGIDAANSTATPLGSGGVFTGVFTSIEDYAAIVISVLADQASATDGFKIQFSSDGSTVLREVLFTYNSTNVGRGYQLPAETKYVRVKYINGTVAQGSFQLQTKLSIAGLQVPEIALIASMSDETQAALVRSVTVGKNPNGTYVNLPATGVVDNNTTTTNLAGGAGFTGTFISTLGYSTVTILINASHDSAANGLVFQWSSDGVTIDRGVSFTYTASLGGIYFALPAEAEYFRVSYTNGATLTTTLHIETTFRVNPPTAVALPLTTRVKRSDTAALVRSDIVPLASARTSQETVGVVSAQLACSSAPLSSRKSISLKSDANNTNNNIIYISFASPATTGNGYGLSNGDSLDIEIADLDDAGSVIGMYAVATNAGQKLHVMEIA
jgi:hypothetical protein